MMSKEQMMMSAIALSIILQVVAVSTNSWTVKKVLSSGNNYVNADMGLWKVCLDGNLANNAVPGVGQLSSDVCTHLPIDGDKTFPKNSLYAVRALSIIAILALMMSLYCMMYMKGKKCILGFLMLGAVSSLVSSSIWVKDFRGKKGEKASLGYSYYLNLLGGLIALISGCCSMEL
jgi:hypothetical protein